MFVIRGGGAGGAMDVEVPGRQEDFRGLLLLRPLLVVGLRGLRGHVRFS